MQSASLGNSRSHPEDYSPTPARALNRAPFIPPRKRKSYAVQPTPAMEPFKDILKEEEILKEFKPIQILFNDENTENDDPFYIPLKDYPLIINNAKQVIFEKTIDIPNESESQSHGNIHHNIWPHKRWLWRTRTAENMNIGQGFSPSEQLKSFIDDEDNKIGRTWYVRELRLKSNEDLHKLWYVLLKEKNMLQSLRFQCRAAKRLMPNYGRLKKMNKSMKRLKCVWVERSLLKHSNREKENEKKDQLLRSNAIEFRRLKLLQKREDIKELFYKTFVEGEKRKEIKNASIFDNKNIEQTMDDAIKEVIDTAVVIDEHNVDWFQPHLKTKEVSK